MIWFDELQRDSTAPRDRRARSAQARGALDVTDLAAQVRSPTLVAHARDDAVVPVRGGPAARA